MCELDFITGLGLGPVMASFEYGNESYGSTKDGKLVVQPNDYQLLQKDSLLYGISYMPDITSKFRTMLVITNLQTILHTYCVPCLRAISTESFTCPAPVAL